MYRDLTATSDARQRLDEVTPLSAVLRALRFEPIGLVEAGKGGSLAEIWVSPDRDAFAEPEWRPGRTPHLSFRTLLTDGSILETSEPRKGWLRVVPFWPRQHHPKAGYHLDQPNKPPHELWLRHCERIKTAAKRAPHATVDDYLALARRSLRVTNWRRRLSQWLGISIFLPFAVWATVTKTAPTWVLPATALVWLLAAGVIFALVLRLPIPKPKPLGSLKSDP